MNMPKSPQYTSTTRTTGVTCTTSITGNTGTPPPPPRRQQPQQPEGTKKPATTRSATPPPERPPTPPATKPPPHPQQATSSHHSPRNTRHSTTTGQGTRSSKGSTGHRGRQGSATAHRARVSSGSGSTRQAPDRKTRLVPHPKAKQNPPGLCTRINRGVTHSESSYKQAPNLRQFPKELLQTLAHGEGAGEQVRHRSGARRCWPSFCCRRLGIRSCARS